MNGLYGQISADSSTAADNRHPAIITHVATATGVKAEAGEAMFRGTGAGPLSKATASITDSKKGDAAATVHVFRLGDIVPGSVTVDFKGTAVKDNGNGALEESEAGSAVIDYATGTVTVTTASAFSASEDLKVTAVSAGDFLGVANEDMDDQDDGVNVVVHGSIVEGIAKFNGTEATTEQLAFLSRHGIY